MVNQLRLEADQKTQIDDIFRRTADDLASAQQDLQNATPQDRAARLSDILAGLRQQVGEVLTDDQKSELAQKLQDLRDDPPAPPMATPPVVTPPVAAPPVAAPPPGRGDAPSTNAPPRPGQGKQLFQRLEGNLAQLNLSSDQQSQINDLLQGMRQKMEQLHASVESGQMPRRVARQKVGELVQDLRQQLAQILTPEQLHKLRDLMASAAQPPPARNSTASPPAAAAQQKEGLAPVPVPVPPFAGNPPASSSATASHPSEAHASPPNQAAAPAIGQAAPDFVLKSLDNSAANLAAYKHRLLVLVLASYTNPTFRDKAAALDSLYEQYIGSGVGFLVIYTRETHPAGGWEVQRNKTDNISIPQPSTEADRRSIADAARSALKLSIPFAVDTMDDKTATAYAVGDGVAAYLIDRDGKVLFHQNWLEPDALEDAITTALKPAPK